MILKTYYDLDRYLQTVIVLGLSLLIGYFLRLVFLKILKIASDRSDDIIIDAIYHRVKGSWFMFLPLIFFLLFFPAESFNENELSYIIKITQTLIIISFSMLAIRLVNVIQDVIVAKYDIGKTDNAKERKIRTQLSFLKRILVVVILTITISMILLNIESVRKYGAALVTSAGVAGIIIGFAAQKTLSNLLAGFQIAFTQPIKIDDAVVVEGEWGWIEEINLTYVVVRIWDLRRLIVPITYFVEKPFQNWTRVTADLIGSVFLYVDYSVPLQTLRDSYDKILSDSKLWDRKIKALQVTESTEKCLEIRLLMGARNSPEAWDLRCEIREKMIMFIQQHYPESLPQVRIERSNLERLMSTSENKNFN